MQLPIGVFGVAVGTAAVPLLARLASEWTTKDCRCAQVFIGRAIGEITHVRGVGCAKHSAFNPRRRHRAGERADANIVEIQTVKSVGESPLLRIVPAGNAGGRNASEVEG